MLEVVPLLGDVNKALSETCHAYELTPDIGCQLSCALTLVSDKQLPILVAPFDGLTSMGLGTGVGVGVAQSPPSQLQAAL